MHRGWNISLNSDSRLYATCAALLSKFGRLQFKVKPVLNYHLYQMISRIDLTDETECRRLCEIMCTRIRSHRNVT